MNTNTNTNKADENKVLREALTNINKDDLLMMFGSSYASYIMTTKGAKEVEEKLTEYYKYDVPVNLGDIIEYRYEQYVVTCVYTDNSVDLLSKDAKKQNVGLYNKPIKKVGKLQVIRES